MAVTATAPARSSPRADLVLLAAAGTAWATLPFTAGEVINDAVADAGSPVRATVAFGAWTLWGAGLAAGLLPLPVTLTLMRLVALAAVAAVGTAVAVAGPTTLGIASLAAAALSTVLVMTAPVGHRHVNGAAYGDEERFPLRAPAATALLLAPLAALVLIGSVGAAAIGLAAGHLAVGIPAAVLAVAAGWVVPRAVHALALRWLVIVPAGVVLHDPLTLADPFLFRHRTVASIGPGPAEGGCDLTAGAAGVALRLTLREPAPLVLRSRSSTLEVTPATAVLFTPVRAGALLAAVSERNRRR